jgi:cytoskeletal protein CcmA (bactofilin family)
LWNKRNSDNSPEEQQRPQPASVFQPAAAPPPPRVEPPPPPRQETARNVAIIGASMKITGQIFSDEALYVDGEVDGSLSLGHSLTVGQNGKVRANVKARDVTIFGSVNGNVEVAEKIAIREKGSLIGDIRTAGIVIDDGAYFKGSIDIVRPEPAKNGKAPQVAAAAKTSA